LSRVSEQCSCSSMCIGFTRWSRPTLWVLLAFIWNDFVDVWFVHLFVGAGQFMINRSF
jgi:hypothetical protein